MTGVVLPFPIGIPALRSVMSAAWTREVTGTRLTCQTQVSPVSLQERRGAAGTHDR